MCIRNQNCGEKEEKNADFKKRVFPGCLAGSVGGGYNSQPRGGGLRLRILKNKFSQK